MPLFEPTLTRFIRGRWVKRRTEENISSSGTFQSLILDRDIIAQLCKAYRYNSYRHRSHTNQTHTDIRTKWLIHQWRQTWWRHEMEAFSALLALCAGNSPVTGKGNSPVAGEFPLQRPMTRSFDAFFDLHLNKRLSNPSRCLWFETPSRPLWRHCNIWPPLLTSTALLGPRIIEQVLPVTGGRVGALAAAMVVLAGEGNRPTALGLTAFHDGTRVAVTADMVSGIDMACRET